MRSASLYDCFERHLLNLDILSETDDCFLNQVVENFLLNICDAGYHFTSHAEDTFLEIKEEAREMLRKKIYGHASVDHFRNHIRQSNPAA